MPERLILRNFQSAGDILMLTATVRDLHRCYPGRFVTDVRSSCSDLWIGNPWLTPLRDDEPGVRPSPSGPFLSPGFRPSASYQSPILRGGRPFAPGIQIHLDRFIEQGGMDLRLKDLIIQFRITHFLVFYIMNVNFGHNCLT